MDLIGTTLARTTGMHEHSLSAISLTFNGHRSSDPRPTPGAPRDEAPELLVDREVELDKYDDANLACTD